MDPIEQNRTPDDPARQGLTLGWRMALSTMLIIGLIMGCISVGQQLIDLKSDEQSRRELLQTSLAPLAVRIEAATDRAEMNLYVQDFHQAYILKGYPEHDVILRDSRGEVVVSTLSAAADEGADYFQAALAVASPLLAGHRGTLVILRDNSEYRGKVRHEWLLWSLHFVVTVSFVSLFLILALYFQVTRPVNRLIAGVRKMEMGYWGSIDTGGGAWEIRWLAERFNTMIEEVRRSMGQLFHAERKAHEMMSDHVGEVARTVAWPDSASQSQTATHPAYLHLVEVCEAMETAPPDDVEAVRSANEIWRLRSREADRRGFHDLKVRIEDAALRLIEPDTFSTLDQRLERLRANWAVWAGCQRETMAESLRESGVPFTDILLRLKHTAGVLAKMRDKNLQLEEIHDLFAFRIIVPTEADCYTALGVVHRVYMPEVARFKDYIARPKENGYQGLHTCVQADDGPVFEVQIRSVLMDQLARHGAAAHWVYKEGTREKRELRRRTPWYAFLRWRIR